MTRPDADRVADIHAASAVAAEVVRHGEAEFTDSLLLQYAAERAIGIIGEAASKLSPAFVDAHPQALVREAAAMRNFLAHEYHKTGSQYVWEAIAVSIPEFVTAITPPGTELDYL